MNNKTVPAALLVLLALVLYWYASEAPAPSQARGEPVATLAVPEETLPPEAIAQLLKNTGPQALPVASFAQPPSSLVDVGLPAPLQTDESGILIVDERLRDVFEHYLTAIGEEPLATIVGRIQHQLQRELSAENYALALSLLDSYLQYRNNIGVIINNHAIYVGAVPFDVEAIVAVKREIRESRSDFMPPDVADALFSKEDAYDNYMMEKLRIHANDSLPENKKIDALAVLDEQALQAGAIGSTLPSALALSRNRSATMRDAGESEATIYEARRELLGEGAADRMAALDAERQEWQHRLREYRQELTSIDGYPKKERAHLVEQIRRRHFQGSELVRVRALDRNR